MGRVHAMVVVALTFAAAATFVTSAQAASVVVQGRGVGDDLIAHRYEAPATGNETLTVVSRLTPTHPSGDWSSITTLDFDRDGRADGLIRIYGTNPVTYQVLRLTKAATVDSIDREHDICLIPDTLNGAATVVGGGTVGISTRGSSRAVAVSADFDAWFGSIARYQPTMVTMWTPAAAALGSQTPVYDYLPDAAGPSDARVPAGNACRGMITPSVQAWGFVLDQSKGDDREIPAGEAPVHQPMPDRQEMPSGDSDLVGATIDRYIANRYATDLTADAPDQSGGTPTFNPADLTLSFAPGGGRASATYFASIGASASTGPFALVRTSAGSDADHITVQMQPGLAGRTFGDGTCFPRNATTLLPNGATWGATTVSMELPVTRDADGVVSVRIALDRALGVFADGGTGNHPTFAWLSTTLPGAGGDPDYAPDFAGQDYTSKFAACTFTSADGDSPGTIVDPGVIPTMRGTAVDAQLALNPAAPLRNETVSFSATPAVSAGFTQYFYDLDGDGLADTLDDAAVHSPTRTKAYTSRTPATVVVRGTDGTYGVALADVRPADPPPVARFTADTPAPYTLGPAGASVGWIDDGTPQHGSTDDGSIDARAWTLTRGSEVITGSGPEFHGAEFHYTFSDGQAGHWTVAYTVTDDEGISSTTTAEFDVLAGDGGPGTGPTAAAIALVSPTGRIFAKRPVTLSAARSSVRVGPAHFTWDLDGDGSYETDTGRQAFVTTTYATAGHRDVRVRLDDGAGATATSAALGLDVAPAADQAPTVVLDAPESVTLNGSSVSAALDATGSTGRNEDPSLTYAWDLDGDGVFETSTGATPRATATFTASGDHTVRVRATDVYGNRAETAKTIFVRGTAEIANACVGREQYRTVTYGPAHATACWTRVDRPSAGPLWIARGDVGLNGLRLTKGSSASAPNRTFGDCALACATVQSAFNGGAQGLRIAFDPSDGSLTSNGAVAIRAEGSGVKLVLNDAPLDVMLPATTSADEDGIILHPPGGAALLSLDLASQAEVRFPKAGEATIAMSVHLPPQMPGAGGDVTLRSTETDGIILDHLKIEVQTGLLSDYLKLADLSVEYDRQDEQWTGHAELGLPGIKGKEFDLEVDVVIANGRFKSIFGQVDGLEIELGEGVMLQRIRAGVGVDPLDLQGGIGLSAGPKIAGDEIFSVDGDVRLTFPSATYPFAVFQVAGNTQLLDEIELTKGVFRFATNGFFEARGGISRQVGLGYFNADIGGWFTVDKLNLTGNAEAGIKFLGDDIKLAEAHAVLSTKGIAACGEIPVIHLGGGIGYRWSGDTSVFRGCDLGPYSEDRPEGIPDGFEVRAAAASAPAVTLPAGLRSVDVAVHGRGAAPKVRLVDAKGTALVDARAEVLTSKVMVLQDAQNATTHILWKAPPKGKYLILPAADSAPVVKVEHAEDAGPQRVRATVRGTGTRRTVAWTVTPKLQKGQQVMLGEATALDGAGSAVTTTTKSRGSVAFTPQEGAGERRVITATILTDGLGRPPAVAARFSAPRTARPAAPRGLTITRSGRTVKLSWTAGATATPAGGWRVALEAGTLRRVRALVAGRRHTFTMADVPSALAVSAEVTGLSSGRRAGTTARATLAAGARRSGAGGAADAVPRALTVRRSGRRLVVRWSGGREAVRRFDVRVRIGTGRTLRLHANADTPRVTVAGLPKRTAAVRVEVRAERFGGGMSKAAVVSGRR